MRIYTYHENIDFHHQNELIDLWKYSWEKQGFEAIVLSISDAEKSPYYEEFMENLRRIHPFITGNELGRYGATCYRRWLAYSEQDETGAFLVADYDVINKNFNLQYIKERQDKISFLDGACPCFAFGTKEQYLNFCKDMVNYTNNLLTEIKQQYEEKKFRHYHDQEFLALNHKILQHFNICPARKYVDFYEHTSPKMEEAKVLHFAHRSIAEAKINFPELKDLHSDELRVEFIKNILKI